MGPRSQLRRPPTHGLLTRRLPLVWAMALAALPAQAENQGKPPVGGVKPEVKKGTEPQRQQPAASDARQPRKTAPEDELKSAFVLQFTRYVQWSETVLRGRETMTIAVVGDEDLGATMAVVLKDKTVGERPVVVTNLGPFVKLTDKAVLKKCQVLVFAGVDRAEWDAIREELGKTAVLTVSTLSGFAKKGGMIELYPDGKGFRFEVAQRALADAGLSASSKLLRLSQPPPDPRTKEGR